MSTDTRQRTYEWDDPAPTAFAGLDRDGLSVLRAIGAGEGTGYPPPTAYPAELGCAARKRSGAAGDLGAAPGDLINRHQLGSVASAAASLRRPVSVALGGQPRE